MVLLDDFSAILVGLQYGRLVFDNLKKTVLYLIPAGRYASHTVQCLDRGVDGPVVSLSSCQSCRTSLSGCLSCSVTFSTSFQFVLTSRADGTYLVE